MIEVKAARAKRSGDGREGRAHRDGGLEAEIGAPCGRSTGEGVQASAWRSTKFEKLHRNSSSISSSSSKIVNNCSSTTSPSTDPGASTLFPSFAEEDRGTDEEEEMAEDGDGNGDTSGEGKNQQGTSTSTSGSRGSETRGDGGRLGFQPPWKSTERKTTGRPNAIKMDFRNPMFHAANGGSEKAVASLFPGEEDCDGSIQPSTNESNPMFKRSVSVPDVGKPRPKSSLFARNIGSLMSSAMADARARDGDASANTTEKEKEGEKMEKENEKGGLQRRKKEKDKEKDKDKSKLMYEHVGRMNVRPFLSDPNDANDYVSGHRGFRVDTFARNEGEAGGKAHFKFVFTLDGVVVPAGGTDAKKLRPVLDAIHERSTGNLRIRVNDGREVSATGSSAVDIAITNIGVVLFNPRTVAKGHHLYTLSLNGRTLFSVLA